MKSKHDVWSGHCYGCGLTVDPAAAVSLHQGSHPPKYFCRYCWPSRQEPKQDGWKVLGAALLAFAAVLGLIAATVPLVFWLRTL